MVISDPTPDSFRLKQSQMVYTDSAFHPKIYAFDAAVSLLGSAVPFTTVRVPTVKSKDGAGVEVAQVVELSDVDAFADYAKAVMMNKEVSLNIYGRPLLQEGKLPKTTVTYNKTVTMKGKTSLDVEFQGHCSLRHRPQPARRIRCHRVPHLAQGAERPEHEWNRADSESLRHDPQHGKPPFVHGSAWLVDTARGISPSTSPSPAKQWVTPTWTTSFSNQAIIQCR